jgi:hypothetical protein
MDASTTTSCTFGACHFGRANLGDQRLNRRIVRLAADVTGRCVRFAPRWRDWADIRIASLLALPVGWSCGVAGRNSLCSCKVRGPWPEKNVGKLDPLGSGAAPAPERSRLGSRSPLSHPGTPPVNCFFQFLLYPSGDQLKKRSPAYSTNAGGFSPCYTGVD